MSDWLIVTDDGSEWLAPNAPELEQLWADEIAECGPPAPLDQLPSLLPSPPLEDPWRENPPQPEITITMAPRVQRRRHLNLSSPLLACLLTALFSFGVAALLWSGRSDADRAHQWLYRYVDLKEQAHHYANRVGYWKHQLYYLHHGFKTRRDNTYIDMMLYTRITQLRRTRGEALHAREMWRSYRVVPQVLQAAQAIATKPYQWGGGHGGFSADGYDCSGSVSYALHGGGLIHIPQDSTSLMSYGAAGPGKKITIYANPTHAFMTIKDPNTGKLLRFDTSAKSISGSRITDIQRSTGGFVARHPLGY